MKTVDIAVESVTVAIKARRMLAKERISSKIVKSDKRLGELGCMYALRIGEADFFAAAAALRRAAISYKLG